MEIEETENGHRQRDKLTLVERIRMFDCRERQTNPHLYIGAVDGLGPNWLFVENVARMLATTVDYVRRVSREELPAAVIGKRVVYARTDVDAYIEARIQRSSRNYAPDRKLRVVTKQTTDDDQLSNTAPFDPVAKVLALGDGK